MVFEKLRRRAPEAKKTERTDQEVFKLVGAYATLLLDVAEQEHAERSEVLPHHDGRRVGVGRTVFRRQGEGFVLEYYLHSTRPCEQADLHPVNQEADQALAYEATFSNYRLPYDQTSVCSTGSFLDSLESVFGPIPAGAEVDTQLV